MRQLSFFGEPESDIGTRSAENQRFIGVAPPPNWPPVRAVCLFEQTGTFRDAFRRAGIPAECWDIEDGFGQTDRRIDLFDAIDKAAEGVPSALDDINADDFVIAFFPCTYFCEMSELRGRLTYYDFAEARKAPERVVSLAYPSRESWSRVRRQIESRFAFFRRWCSLLELAYERDWHLVCENPWNPGGWLHRFSPGPPTLIDRDRSAHGDAFKKPTAFYMVNFAPRLPMLPLPHARRRVRDTSVQIERSRILPGYADNFVRRVVLGDSSWRPSAAPTG